MGHAAFCRVEVFARSRSPLARSHVATVDELVDEIARKPGCREHVDDLARPGDKIEQGFKPPVVVFGCDPSDVPALIEREIEARKAGGDRRPRRDTPVVAGYVVSVPVSPARFRRDPSAAAWTKRVFRASLRHLRHHAAARGGRVVSAAVHLDESRVHMHVIALPTAAAGYNANLLHPGRAARRAAQAAGEDAVRASKAASAALAAFLDDYHAAVGRAFGLRRRRLPAPRRRQSRAALVRTRRPDRAASPDRPAATNGPMRDGHGWRLADFVAGADALLERLGSGPDPGHGPSGSTCGPARGGPAGP
jgi:hypothetical protein